ncbi:hypothetical protein EV715DRAFT_297331 [Schizophyllum commune]
MSTGNASNAAAAATNNEVGPADGATERVVATTAEVQALLEDAFRKRAAAEAAQAHVKELYDINKRALESTENINRTLHDCVEEHLRTARLRAQEVRQVKRSFRSIFVSVQEALGRAEEGRPPALALAALKECLEQHQETFDNYFAYLELEDDMDAED